MENTTPSSRVPAEKDLSSATPSLAYEGGKALELGDPVIQNDEKDIAVLDDAGIKSTSDPTEPSPATQGNEDGDSTNLPPEPAVERPGPPGKDYSILTVAQKRAIVIAASFASLFSPMATAIYCESPKQIL